MSRHVHRRDFLKLTGGALAGTSAIQALDPPDKARLWREYMAAPDTHPQIPNVSFAGYRRGERRIPRTPIRVNVRAFGAKGDGVTDDTEAVNRAIAALAAMVGIRGTTGPTDHPKDFTGPMLSVVEALDRKAQPANLYEAQLRQRLRHGPHSQ